MKLSEIFAKNRAEEFPDDVFGKYVLPRNYSSVDLSKMTKACIIIGGRGYGKTMFLKYHCHHTLLSKNHDKVTLDDLKSIGIYWRPDTSYTQHMSLNWAGKFWPSVFKTYVTLSILVEMSELLVNLSSEKSPLKKYKSEILSIPIPELISEKIGEKNIIKLSEGIRTFQNALFKLCDWMNAPYDPIPPITLDVKTSLDLIIMDITKVCPELKKSHFHVFIDEFENLTESQQEIINSLMKHGEPPLLFSVAYKKNAKVSHKSLGNEHVVEGHDYRIIDLENLYIDDFDVFAGEILAIRLAELNPHLSIKQKLIVKSGLASRKHPAYQRLVKDLGTSFLPEYSSKEISDIIINDKAMFAKLLGLIEIGLKSQKNHNNIKAIKLIDKDFPEASIVNAALVNRKNIDVVELHGEFLKYKLSKETKYKSWIPNNLYGMIIHIYNLFPSKHCPLYAGYNQFIKISRGNIRHFLELCHQSVLKSEVDGEQEENNLDEIKVEIQAFATKRASELEIDKISDLGAQGIHLKRVVKRIGRIFNYAQSRRSQSESEINHFTLDLSDITSLSENTQSLLLEALIWSVLIEQKSTKSKSDDTLEEKDYLLHPVLSPYFGISYRKKRKLKFNIDELEVIFLGDDIKYTELLKSYKRRWSLEESDEMDGEFVGSQLGLL